MASSRGESCRRAIATIDTPDPKLGKGEFGFTYDIDPEKPITKIAVHPEELRRWR
jgi:hypothetical protein